MTSYRSVVLDADSTLSNLEGIDWLAALRGPAAEARVAALTDEAMAGSVALESVYRRRLEIIGPTVAEMEALAQAYIDAMDPTAPEALARIHAAGVVVHVVSGGLRPALLPMTRLLGIDDRRVHAVEVSWSPDGRWEDVVPTPLTTQNGKPQVVAALGLPAPILAVGDGATDLALRTTVDTFAAYVGFVRREAVVCHADVVVTCLADVADLVAPLSRDPRRVDPS